MDKDVKILPCPFCGGEAQVWPTYAQYGVICDNGCCSREGDYEEDAINEWNRRDGEPLESSAYDRRRKELEEALGFNAIKKAYDMLIDNGVDITKPQMWRSHYRSVKLAQTCLSSILLFLANAGCEVCSQSFAVRPDEYGGGALVTIVFRKVTL